jgi:hypothetical protein
MAGARTGREVRRAVADRGTPFFLSYAHADGNTSNPGVARLSDQMAEQFYYDLTQDVAQLISLPTGSDIGFMDVAGLRGGMDWTPELMLALGTCQVLVALVSAPYLSSRWCGMEWDAFSRRRIDQLPGAKPSPNQRCIIPVWWAPVRGALPSPIRQDMIFSPPRSRPLPDLPELYRRHGIFGLVRQGERDCYSAIVWHLARLIEDLYSCQHVRHRKFRPGSLRNVFEGDAQ